MSHELARVLQSGDAEGIRRFSDAMKLIPGGSASRPWLISGSESLMRDALNRVDWTQRWKETFPGVEGTYRAKQAWSAKIKNEPMEDFELLGPLSSRPCDEGEVLADMLHEVCPEVVTLELLVPRSAVAGLVLSEDSAARLMASSERRVADTPAANKRFPAFRKWLAGADAATAIGAGGARLGAGECDYVLLGSKVVNRDDDLNQAIGALAKSLGLESGVLMAPFGPTHGGEHLYDSFRVLRSKVGQMPHYPSGGAAAAAPPPKKKRGKGKKAAGGGGGGGSSSVAMVLYSHKDKKKGAAKGKSGKEGKTTLREEVRELAKSSGKRPVLVAVKGAEKAEGDEETSEKEEEEEEEEATAANTMVCWLPSCYSAIRERVRNHCEHGEGECERVKDDIGAGTTRTGNRKIELYSSELEAVKVMSRKVWEKRFPGQQLGDPEKLCTLLAMVESMRYDSYWLNDNEFPEEADAVIEGVAKMLRALLKKSDEELGIGVTLPPRLSADSSSSSSRSRSSSSRADSSEPPPSSVHGPAASRAALYALLEVHKGQLLDASSYSEAKFNFMPPKKKRPAAESSSSSSSSSAAAAKRQKLSEAASSGESADGGKSIASFSAFISTDVPSFGSKAALQLRCTRVVKAVAAAAAGGGKKKKKKKETKEKQEEEEVRVLLVSPKASFWKLSQFVAFAFGLSDSSEYHSQKGSVLPGTTCTVSRPERKGPGHTPVPVLICSKRAAGTRAFLVDKQVQAGAVFRCESVTKRSFGMAGAAAAPKQSKADKATVVAFDFGDGEVRVSLDGIGETGKMMLPVIVESSACELEQSQLDRINQAWLGDRQGPQLIVFGATSQSEVNAMVWRCQRRPLFQS